MLYASLIRNNIEAIRILPNNIEIAKNGDVFV